MLVENYNQIVYFQAAIKGHQKLSNIKLLQ